MPRLYDERSRVSAPRQLYAAVLALANGRPLVGYTTTEEAPDGSLLWKTLGVVDRSILLVQATGPDDDDNWSHPPLGAVEVDAAIYPSSVLTHVSSRAEFSPRFNRERVIITRYTAHLGSLGSFDIDTVTGEALLSLLGSRT